MLRNTVRVWDYNARKITNTIRVMAPDGSPALGLMDVKLLPNDPNGTAYTIGMFDGFLYKTRSEEWDRGSGVRSSPP